MLHNRLKIIQTRAAQANKAALETEKERDELHTQIEEIEEQLQPKRTCSDADTGNAHEISLCETFVSGGFFTLFHCSIPRARNPCNHHTRESLKGLCCVNFSLYQTLSTLSTLSLSLSLSQLWVSNVSLLWIHCTTTRAGTCIFLKNIF